MSPYNAPVSLFTLLSLIPLALAHVQLVDPYPILSPMNPAVPWDEKNYNMMVPLTWEGDNLPYPCKGYLTSTPESDRLSQKSWPAGSTQTLSFGTGGAPHLGGSCQVVLSYDNGETWQVIYSYIGGCMIESWSWSFPIPSEAPSGQAVLGWNWFNNQGNREMYQNCAVVTITDGGEGLPEGDDYPSPFVANAKFNECSTVEGTDPVFPRPGKNVRWSGKYKDGKRPALGYGITGQQCEDMGDGRAPAGANGLVQGEEVVQSTTSTSAGPSVTSTEADMSSSTGETSTTVEQAEATQPPGASATSASASETSSSTEASSTSATAPASLSPTEEAISTAAPFTTSSATSSVRVEEASASAASSSPAALSTTPTASASQSAVPGDANGHIAFPPPSGSATADDASYTPVPALSSPFASSSSPSSIPAGESHGVMETVTEESLSASRSTDRTSTSTLAFEQSRTTASASTAAPTAISSATANAKTTHTSDGSASSIGPTDSAVQTATSATASATVEYTHSDAKLEYERKHPGVCLSNDLHEKCKKAVRAAQAESTGQAGQGGPSGTYGTIALRATQSQTLEAGREDTLYIWLTLRSG